MASYHLLQISAIKLLAFLMLIAKHSKLYDIDLAYGCNDGTYLCGI
ncbi:hypothetical protein [uncultured Campylobacter sp.]|nr:hypothetical protein [uncultured Campylobacter sp.]